MMHIVYYKNESFYLPLLDVKNLILRRWFMKSLLFLVFCLSFIAFDKLDPNQQAKVMANAEQLCNMFGFFLHAR